MAPPPIQVACSQWRRRSFCNADSDDCLIRTYSCLSRVLVDVQQEAVVSCTDSLSPLDSQLVKIPQTVNVTVVDTCAVQHELYCRELLLAPTLSHHSDFSHKAASNTVAIMNHIIEYRCIYKCLYERGEEQEQNRKRHVQHTDDVINNNRRLVWLLSKAAEITSQINTNTHSQAEVTTYCVRPLRHLTTEIDR